MDARAVNDCLRAGPSVRLFRVISFKAIRANHASPRAEDCRGHMMTGKRRTIQLVSEYRMIFDIQVLSMALSNHSEKIVIPTVSQSRVVAVRDVVAAESAC